MKFLPRERETGNLIPLNFIYNRGEGFGNDSLTIIYKDNISGMKSVYTINKPEMEIYIVKPEFRTFDNDITHHWYPIDKCNVYRVKYASRYYEAAKILGLKSVEDARLNPYIYGAEIDIENYYTIHFIKEYPCTGLKNINCGFLDIENDIIRLNHFPEYGESPINAVTYIDGLNRYVYTLVLMKDDIPVLQKDHPKYAEMEEFREKFKEQSTYVKEHTKELIQEYHENFDEIYGEMEYHLIFVDDEMKLQQLLWEIIKKSDNDFVEIYNLSYDMQNLIIRPQVLGYDVNELIPDERILKSNPNLKVSFREDTNPVVHKKKHVCVTATMQTFLCQMIDYAGIRSGKGKLPSNKLNYVARAELKDEKLDYSEDGDIKTLFYRNLIKFIKYNLKDVLLQFGIEKHTKDLQTIYSYVYENFVTYQQSFTTTKVVFNSLYAFALEHGFVLGQNRNKGNKDNNTKFGEKFANITEDMDEDEYFATLSEDGDDEEEEEDSGTKKRKKFDGAFVMNTLYINPTGVKIGGRFNKWVHEDVADADVTSEYPTAMIIGNISSETLVGKVFLEGELPNIPFYEGYEFRGNERSKYKFDVSNFMMECYSERDYGTFGSLFLDLPTVEDILLDIEKSGID